MTDESRAKILIVDDSAMNRSILIDILEAEYDLIEAENGREAVEILEKLDMNISLILLDIVMPEMDGFDVLAMMNKRDWIEDIPVIIISAETSSSYLSRAYELGVTDYINRPFDDMVVRRRVINTIMLYAKQKKLLSLVADQIEEKEKSSSLMVSILSHIVEFRNGESGLHVLHIQTITEILLQHMIQMTDKYSMPLSEISLITMAAALHDIGKISIPDEVINKPGKLTDEEFEVMKTHAAVGAQMLSQIPMHREEKLVKIAVDICRWHHERYDGKGYPDGLKGEEIPISAQIVAIADVYDALTSERVYKKAFSHEKAMNMIMDGECGAFNPIILQCLRDCEDKIQEELAVKSLRTSNTEREMRGIVNEMLESKEISASERSLKLLEHERIKYKFFASMSQEIQFEFTKEPPMLTISEWGAEHLGIREIIMDPLHDEEMLRIFDREELEEVVKLLHATSPEEPIMTYECMLKQGEKNHRYQIICRSLWSGDEEPEYTGFIGKAVDVHTEFMRVRDLERKASHDGLTGLVNHETIRKLIEERFARNPDSNFALIILDLDFFKTINDKHGHLCGDRVLQQVAEKMRQSVRGTDIISRVGGDEFLIFLEYKTDLEPTVDRIFHSITGVYEDCRVTFSMGVAKNDSGTADYDTMFHSADQALYAAKRGGRDQYCFYNESMKDMFSALSPIEEITSDGREEDADGKVGRR